MGQLDWLSGELARWDKQHLRRRRRVVTPLPDGRCIVDGRTLLNSAGNDYLGLAMHPEVIDAARAAMDSAGVGARGSALVCGRTEWHERLEQRLAEFEGQPAAILFPTGMAANVGTLTALMGREDVVFCDRSNHASLVDGCRLSGARLRVYRHDDFSSLERHLATASGCRRKFVITDAVFSMEGDLAPLPTLCQIAADNDAVLIVDEAHATGVFGPTGRGAAEHFGVEEQVDVRIGTLSKALGTIGGFVTGSPTLIDFLWNSARTQMFSTALPPAICAATIAALDVLQREPDRLQRLHAICSQFRAALLARGVLPLEGSIGPIVPIVLGESSQAMACAAELEQLGYLVGAIRPPTVPQGTSRLRFSLSLAIPENDVQQLADAVVDVMNRHSR